jgi:hypothetical protein
MSKPHTRSSSPDSHELGAHKSTGYQQLQRQRKQALSQNYDGPDEQTHIRPEKETWLERKTEKVSFDLPKLNDVSFLSTGDADKTGDYKSPTKQQRTDAKQNAGRVEHQDKCNKELISKYLPPSLDNVFNETVEGPDDASKPPPWLLKAIQEVANAPAPPPKAPRIKFSTDPQSLANNAELLDIFGFNITELLDHFADTTLGYGSEFQPTKQLNKVFRGHPNFGFFRTILKEGMSYFFEQDILEEQRVNKLEANLERGNHKSTTSEPAITKVELLKDV